MASHIRDGRRNARYAASVETCYLCDGSLSERQDVLGTPECDRRDRGDTLGICAGTATCTPECRCGYFPENLGIAHKWCQTVLREAMAPAEFDARWTARQVPSTARGANRLRAVAAEREVMLARVR